MSNMGNNIGDCVDLFRTVVGMLLIIAVAYILQFVFVGITGISEPMYNISVFIIASVFYVFS